MRGWCKSFAILSVVALGACAPAAATGGPRSDAGDSATGQSPPPNIILLIGDGAGLAYWSAAKLAGDSLAIERMPVAGLVDTRGSDYPRLVDSAAGATAFASGVRSYNGAIGVGVRCRELMRADSAAVMRDPASCDPLPSFFDLARERGMSTGLITTTNITDATPAAFASHVPDRSMQAEVAQQYIRKGIDVLMGGGRDFFDGTARADGRDLLVDLCQRAVCLSNAEEFNAYRPDDRSVVGLFAPRLMPAAAEREPSLAMMTRAALAKLSRNPAGFVLMVEEEGTDEAGHHNWPLPQLLDEVRSLNAATEVALAFAQTHPNTLVIVVADHETGGLTLKRDADTLAVAYSTTGHTHEMVPLFAAGPGAERFGGVKENWEIGRLLMDVVRAEQPKQ
jgi:alkaline phosphatase